MLTAIRLSDERKSTKRMWECRCECGNTTLVETHNLVDGRIKSCGCMRTALKGTKGHSHERLYQVWKGMKARCENPKADSYKYYGAIGVKVCGEWKNDYEAFRAWAYKNGYDDTKPFRMWQIDRIDQAKGYEPKNCRFVTATENVRNRRCTLRATMGGVDKSVAEWCEIFDKDYDLVCDRLNAGWGIEDALLKPKQEQDHSRKQYDRVYDGTQLTMNWGL